MFSPANIFCYMIISFVGNYRDHVCLGDKVQARHFSVGINYYKCIITSALRNITDTMVHYS